MQRAVQQAVNETRPLILLAPGAGAGSDSAWMHGWRQRLADLGTVAAFDYPYRRAGRKAPDKLPVLVAAHREALQEARLQHPRAPATVLAGKSMGGRVGCHLALEDAVDAVICLGYPLRGASGTWRDEVLLALRIPVLFVQGTRDPLCPLDALAAVRQKMTAPNELFVVEGGNHSLEVPRRPVGAGARTKSSTPGPSSAPPSISPAETPPADTHTHTQVEWDAAVLRAIAAFLTGRVGAAGDRK